MPHHAQCTWRVYKQCYDHYPTLWQTLTASLVWHESLWSLPPCPVLSSAPPSVPTASPWWTWGALAASHECASLVVYTEVWRKCVHEVRMSTSLIVKPPLWPTKMNVYVTCKSAHSITSSRAWPNERGFPASWSTCRWWERWDTESRSLLNSSSTVLSVSFFTISPGRQTSVLYTILLIHEQSTSTVHTNYCKLQPNVLIIRRLSTV